MTEQPAIDRIPIGVSINFAVRNAPEVPNKYGAGSLTPTEITLTYRSTEDSQLGRVHAYIKGRWRRDAVLEATDMPLPGQHYTGDPSTWPDWLAEEARHHAPATTAVDRSALRELIAEAIAAKIDGTEGCANRYRLADAVLAVLPDTAPSCNHSFPDPFPDSLNHIGNCRRCDISYQDARRQAEQLGTEMPTSAAPLASGLPLVKGNCPACRRASLFLGTGGYPTCSNADCPEPDAATTVLEQYAHEAHDPEHTWAAELHDPLADEWVPGTRYAARDRAVNALAHSQRLGPAWKDGTPTRRRLVRATTTYTVEQPVPCPERVADEQNPEIEYRGDCSACRHTGADRD
ncbi:hypothetical protein [Streptomyces osmaniensis]|uniref:Uncharacterized protein n=1 Tax=Streptomyces osmaniensis TaxID=593134 RepID=A0ABP6YY15_9ACTN|nr:hypothetical protein KJK32_46590 [Streptomyces sp. JCM17656]